MKVNAKFLLFSMAIFGAGFLVSCGSDNASQSDVSSVEESAQTNPQEMQVNTMEAAQDVVANQGGPTTTVQFIDGMVHEYGTINAGDKVSHSFKFKNTGSEPLVISNCKGSCGCTVPVCPTTPIAPGEMGEIPVEFDSKGKNGPDTKTVTIVANTNPSQTVLTIRGEVKGTTPGVQMQ